MLFPFDTWHHHISTLVDEKVLNRSRVLDFPRVHTERYPLWCFWNEQHLLEAPFVDSCTARSVLYWKQEPGDDLFWKICGSLIFIWLQQNLYPTRTLTMCSTVFMSPVQSPHKTFHWESIRFKGLIKNLPSGQKGLHVGIRPFCKITLTVWWMNSHLMGFQNIWVHLWTFGESILTTKRRRRSKKKKS